MTLPNFLICGAQKAGTTALYAYLKQHPDVFMSPTKEIAFFHKPENYQKGLEWFASHFEGHGGETAVGEASTRTMSMPEAPARVAEHLPEAKLIFVLRNPIDRAYSQYHFHISTGKEEADASFHEVIRDEQSAFRRIVIQRGMYAEQLARFDAHFDRSQMKIVLHEDLRERTTETVQEVYRFLGVDPTYEPQTEERHNVTRYPDSLGIYYWVRRLWQPMRQRVESRFPQATDALRQAVRGLLFSREKPAMQEADRAYLREVFAESNARLEARLERDLSHWR
jgi:hypothetical protein